MPRRLSPVFVGLPALALSAAAPAATPVTVPAASPVAWGAHGHEIVARAAATGLPGEMPPFFRARAAELEYLNPEPDRWREWRLEEMDEAYSYDHYIDLENVPDGAVDAPNRWEYLRRLYAAGLERPERDAGFLPFRIVELYQRLVTELRLWRDAPERERPWIENRIVHDAGILGHYVADASQPHHTTIHYNGWDDEAPNPEGFSTKRGFHSRFESAFVGKNVRFEDVLSAMGDTPPRTLEDVRSAVMEHIMEAHAEVGALYRLDRDVGFDPDRPRIETRAFAVDRLVAGAEALRDLWWSAWIESARPVEGEEEGR